MLHQGIRLRDVATDPKWHAVTELDTLLIHVIQPKAEESAAAATDAAAPAAEPEVAKKGKTDKDDDAGDKDKKDKK
jgi:hypothetical protein